MRKIITGVVTLFLGFFAIVSTAQEIRYKVANGTIIIPDSSIAKPEDAGKRMHTNYEIFIPDRKFLARSNAPDPSGETPASLACIYGLTPQVPGCPINGTTAVPTGGWGAIAVVDACLYPDAEQALNTFSAQFGLPACTFANGCFTQVYASGSKPPCTGDGGEASIDIEWAHAMAPNAKIILVETASGTNADLYQGEDLASQLVVAAGGGEISNSFAGPEMPGEAAFDVHFQTPGIVYFASSADSSAPAQYPSSSPYVVSAGGTSIVRVNGLFVGENAWSKNANGRGSSGGPSIYEKRPAYQNGVAKIVGTQRGTPDISFDADGQTAADVYVINPTTHIGSWMLLGGTSLASPSLAGIVNSAGSRATSTFQELNLIYGKARKNYHSYWHDIIIGNNGFPCMAGYDFVTGLGSALGYSGK